MIGLQKVGKLMRFKFKPQKLSVAVVKTGDIKNNNTAGQTVPQALSRWCPF